MFIKNFRCFTKKSFLSENTKTREIVVFTVEKEYAECSDIL